MKHGLADVLHATRSGEGFDEIYAPIVAAVRHLMSACERAGEIRAGTAPEDFLMLMGSLWRIPPNAAGEARVKRLMTLLFRGIGAELE